MRTIQTPPSVVAVVLILSLGCSGAFLQAQDRQAAEAAKPAPLTEQQQKQVKERDRLQTQVSQFTREGKLREAIHAVEQMLIIEREVFGNTHDEVIGSLLQLTKLQAYNGEFKTAAALAREAQDGARKLHGDQHWRTSNARRALELVAQLAALDRDQLRQLWEAERQMKRVAALDREDKTAEAILLAQEALAARTRLLGAEHYDTSVSLYWLGALYYNQREYDRAGATIKQTLAIRRKLLGTDHPGCADCLNYLGQVASQRKDYVEAVEQQRQALAIFLKTRGETHTDTTTTRRYLSSALEGLARTAEERAAFADVRQARQDVADLQVRLHGAAHWRAIDARLALEHCELLARFTTAEREELAKAGQQEAQVQQLFDQGKFDEAIPLQEQVLKTRQRLLRDHPDVAISLGALANLYRAVGQYARAEPLYQRGLEIKEAKLGKDHPDVATSLNNLARLYRDMGQHARAEPLHRRSLEIKEEKLGKDHLGVAATLGELAVLYKNMGQYATAEPLYQRSLDIYEAKLGKDHPHVAVTLSNLAMFYTDMGQYARAEPLLHRSLAIHEAKLGKDHLDVASSLNNLAVLYERMGQSAKAEQLHQRSLEIKEAKLGKDHLGVAISLNNLALLYQASGQHARAEQLYQRSLEIYEAKLGKDHPDVANTLNNLALLYEEMAQYARAEALYQRSLEITETKLGKDHPDVAITLSNLAVYYKKLGQYAKAEPLYLRSLELYEMKFGKDHPDVAISLNNLASYYQEMGQYAKAEPLYQRSLEIKETKLGKDHPDVAITLSNLAGLYQDFGQHAKAESLYQRSLQIREAKLGKDHLDVATSLNNLAVLYRAMGQDLKAEVLSERSLEIREAKLGKDHPDVAISLNSLALLYQDMGQYAKAEPLHRRSLEIREAKLGKDHPDVAIALNNLASHYHDMGQHTKAEALYRRSLSIHEAKKGKEHPDVAIALNNLAALSAEQGNWDQAVSLRGQARRVARRHVSRVLPTLPEKEQLIFLQTQDERAFHAALSLALQRSGDAATVAQSAAWLVNGKGVAHEALAQRALRDRGAAPQESADPWITLEQVRKELPADAVFIDVARFDVRNIRAKGQEEKWQPAHYAAWIVPATGQGDVRLIDLGAADRIDAAVTAVRQGLLAAQGSAKAPSSIKELGEDEAEKQLKPALAALARLVLHPLLDEIGTKKRWVVSPDASLWLVPWAALPLPDGKYAVEKHTLQYVTSGRDLLRVKPTANAGRPIILADPDFDLERNQARTVLAKLIHERPKPSAATRGLSFELELPAVKRLPGTATEAAFVKPKLEAYAGEEPYVYRQANAQETLFKSLERPRVLVLSTHGFFLADQETEPAADNRATSGPPRARDGKPLENPLLRCGLLLAGCNNHSSRQSDDDDGILTGLEVVGCDLRGTELVVLSACETGLGEVRNGEGVAGLRQAFQLAGAQAVLATLWQVSDKDTALLMIDFFDHLAKGKSKAEALREAQLARIAAHRKRDSAAHPYFWAAFTVTGQ